MCNYMFVIHIFIFTAISGNAARKEGLLVRDKEDCGLRRFRSRYDVRLGSRNAWEAVIS